MGRRSCTYATVAVAALAVIALRATPALAKTEVRVSGGELVISADLVTTNDILVTTAAPNLLIVQETKSDGPKVDAGRHCTQSATRRARCPAGEVSSVRAELKGGFFDDYDGSALAIPQTVNGGTGNDDITTGVANDTLNGEAGEDVLHGGPGQDQLNGGINGPVDQPGEPLALHFVGDQLDGGPGGYTIKGGPGKGDEVFYPGHESARRTANLGTGISQLLDQTPPEPLDVIFADVERVTGDRGPDTLTGSARDDILAGGDGPQPDTLDGLAGDDQLLAGDNKARDSVSCGPGDDYIELDLVDVPPEDPAVADCEEIQRTAIDQHPAVSILKRSAKVKGETVRVPLACPRKHHRRGCRGTLTVRQRGGDTLARRRYRIRRGKRRTVKARLSPAGRRLVAGPGRLRVEVVASERDPRGRPRVRVSRFSLRGS
jgi:Ca2+-binding RTX toxin-like protein